MSLFHSKLFLEQVSPFQDRQSRSVSHHVTALRRFYILEMLSLLRLFSIPTTSRHLLLNPSEPSPRLFSASIYACSGQGLLPIRLWPVILAILPLILSINRELNQDNALHVTKTRKESYEQEIIELLFERHVLQSRRYAYQSFPPSKLLAESTFLYSASLRGSMLTISFSMQYLHLPSTEWPRFGMPSSSTSNRIY